MTVDMTTRPIVKPEEACLYPISNPVRLDRSRVNIQMREACRHMIQACFMLEEGTAMEWSQQEDRLVISLKPSALDIHLFPFLYDVDQVWIVMAPAFCLAKDPS